MYYEMSYDKAIVGSHCQYTCNQTSIANIINSMCIKLVRLLVFCAINFVHRRCSWKCARWAAKRDWHEFISGTAVTPVEVTILSIQFPLPCVIGLRVYMSYSYSNNSIGRGKDGRMSCIIITAQCMSHIFYLYCWSIEFCVTYTV